MSERDEQVEALAKLVTEHREDFSEHCCLWHDGCDCGWKDSGDEDSSNAAYAGHLVQTLLDSPAMRDLLAEERAKALREAADEMVGRHGTNPAARFLRARADGGLA